MLPAAWTLVVGDAKGFEDDWGEGEVEACNQKSAFETLPGGEVVVLAVWAQGLVSRNGEAWRVCWVTWGE